MHTEAQIDSENLERMEKQNGLLLRTYRAEFAKDPTSRATESARSNLIAQRHTIGQMYGESTAMGLAEALDFVSVAASCGEWS
jgi:hypothetical protein